MDTLYQSKAHQHLMDRSNRESFILFVSDYRRSPRTSPKDICTKWINMKQSTIGWITQTLMRVFFYFYLPPPPIVSIPFFQPKLLSEAFVVPNLIAFMRFVSKKVKSGYSGDSLNILIKMTVKSYQHQNKSLYDSHIIMLLLFHINLFDV